MSRSISGGRVAENNKRLPVGRNLFDDGADVRHESHVEHAIDFIEDENVYVAKMHRLLFEMVEQTSRSRGDNVNPAVSNLPFAFRNRRRRATPSRANR